MERTARDSQHVGLATAAAVVLFQLTGKDVNGARSGRTKAQLNDVAHALSSIVTVYAPDARGTPRPLPPNTLMSATFERGAQVLRTADGKEIGGLSVQRRDILAAISILRSANAKFDR
jgi:hypothetical protein